ncbi:MAG: hypothetical protein R2828_34990 [Saprospiraceae bacterium]
MTILIKDDTIGGETNNSFEIEISKKSATVKELIKLRIYKEVESFNQRLPEYFKSLVQPTEAEVTLNGYKMIEKRKIDPEKQYYLALDAFDKNGYFLIINNKQVDSLEQKIKIIDKMELQFIKLTPLVGG